MSNIVRVLTIAALLAGPASALLARPAAAETRYCTADELTLLLNSFTSDAALRAGYFINNQGRPISIISSCRTDGHVFAYRIDSTTVGPLSFAECKDGAGCTVGVVDEGSQYAIYSGSVLVQKLDVTYNGMDTPVVVTGGAGDDILVVSALHRATIIPRVFSLVDGKGGNDTIIMGAGNDYVDAGTGDDFVLNLGGADSVGLGPGYDVFLGGDDAELVDGGNDDDIMVVGGGDDVANGQAGNDIIRGGSGADHVNGGDGNDRLDGGSGADIITGGNGNDTILGGQGDDTINGNGGDDAILGELDKDTVYADDGTDYVDGGDGDDNLYGGAKGDIVLGGSGADTMYGNDGQDVIWGESNPDVLWGGKRSDKCAGELTQNCEGGISSSQKSDLLDVRTAIDGMVAQPEAALDGLKDQWTALGQGVTSNWPAAAENLRTQQWLQASTDYAAEIRADWSIDWNWHGSVVSGVSWLISWIEPSP